MHPPTTNTLHIMEKTRTQLGTAGVVLAAIVLFGGLGCGDGRLPRPNQDATTQPAEAALLWNKLYLEVERYAPNYRPCPSARALAYLGLASYEACLSGMPGYGSIARQVLGLSLPAPEEDKEYYWPEVVNAAYGYLMPLLFPHLPAAERQKITNLETQLDQKYFGETTERTFIHSRIRGREVAQVLWAWARADGVGHDAYQDPFRGYKWETRNTKPYDWEPVGPGPNNGFFPYWGGARVFALNKGALLCRPPLPYSEQPNSLLYAQAVEVYAQNTPSWPQESRWIAQFWSDDLEGVTFSSAARWIAIANQALEKESASLATALEVYAKLGIALNDAVVGCWNSKYHYNIERPQSYIRRLIDPNWKSNLRHPLTGEEGINPPFPSFPAEHAVMGAAAAEVLSGVFGYRYPMTDRCHQNRSEFVGTPRSFSGFHEMARESAESRIILGVHFRMDTDEGFRYGTTVGQQVNQLPWKR
jgi:hypothetical protein